MEKKREREKEDKERNKDRKAMSMKCIHYKENILNPKFNAESLTAEEQITGKELIY